MINKHNKKTLQHLNIQDSTLSLLVAAHGLRTIGHLVSLLPASSALLGLRAVSRGVALLATVEALVRLLAVLLDVARLATLPAQLGLGAVRTAVALNKRGSVKTSSCRQLTSCRQLKHFSGSGQSSLTCPSLRHLRHTSGSGQSEAMWPWGGDVRTTVTQQFTRCKKNQAYLLPTVPALAISSPTTPSRGTVLGEVALLAALPALPSTATTTATSLCRSRAGVVTPAIVRHLSSFLFF